MFCFYRILRNYADEYFNNINESFIVLFVLIEVFDGFTADYLVAYYLVDIIDLLS